MLALKFKRFNFKIIYFDILFCVFFEIVKNYKFVFRQSVVKTLLVKGKTATRRKNCAALNKEKEDYRGRIFVLPLAEASIAFVWTSAYAGAQTFAVCGALPHTLFFLNFLITPRFWYSYSLLFSVLCVAE